MADSTIELIKSKLDIVDFLRGYLKLVPAGKNYKAVCPFHKEKSPSFMISPDRGIWHCFGCSAGGDVIKFVMQYENLEFYDALKILAEKAGIELKSIVNRDFHAHNVLYKALEAAKEFFKNQLANSPESRKYFLDRGLKSETIAEFELGLAPAGQDVLLRGLLKAGFNVVDLERAGLVLKTDRGTYWDRFRERLMFPIHNHLGKVVGFTGRVLPGRESDKVGKYVNSPETPVFQKSKILYGFYKTKNDIRQNNSAVLVEGQMDFLMSWQSGVKNIVATSGTALTADHLAALRRLADSAVMGFDADDAGIAAAERAVDMAGASDFNTKVLMLGGFKDPADLAEKDPVKLKEAVASALPAMQYYFYKYLNALRNDQIIEKKRGIRMVLSKIAGLSSAVERSYWLKELASLTAIEESALAEEMSSVKTADVGIGAVKAETPQDPILRKDLICQRIIALSLNHDELRGLTEAYLEYFPPLYKGAAVKLLNASGVDSEEVSAEGLSSAVTLISLRSSLDAGEADHKKLNAEFQDLLRQLKIEFLKEKRQKVRLAMASVKNEEEESKLLEEHRLVDQELQKL
ncbi:MAG: DNA primase [bacterium]|nr:DNA primase [bacterium]